MRFQINSNGFSRDRSFEHKPHLASINLLSFRKSPWLFLQVTKKTSLTNIYIITGLIQSTRYNIQVTTLTTKGDSPKSKVLPVTTKKLETTALDDWRESLGINTIVRQLDGAVNDITNLNTGFSNLKSGVRSLKSDATNLKSDVRSLKSGANNLKTGIRSLTSGVTNLKRDVNILRSNVRTHQDLSSVKFDSQWKQIVSINIQFENNIP